MSKASKERQRQKRKEAKKARKMANYLRFGPKKGGITKKAAPKTVGEGKTELSPPAKKDKTSAKGRKRRRKNGLRFMIKR